MAAGSANELACQLRIATDLAFGEPNSAEQLRIETNRVSKMLSRLITFHRNQPAWKKREGRP